MSLGSIVRDDSVPTPEALRTCEGHDLYSLEIISLAVKQLDDNKCRHRNESLLAHVLKRAEPLQGEAFGPPEACETRLGSTSVAESLIGCS